jgi:hypothetical protein
VLWSGLERQVDAVVQDAKQRLAGAGVVFVDVDMPEVLTLSEQIIFPVALHEPISEIPKYLSENGATGIQGQRRRCDHVSHFPRPARIYRALPDLECEVSAVEQ